MPDGPQLRGELMRRHELAVIRKLTWYISTLPTTTGEFFKSTQRPFYVNLTGRGSMEPRRHTLPIHSLPDQTHRKGAPHGVPKLEISPESEEEPTSFLRSSHRCFASV
jgi:hypothetical protein